jgi:hypothetical protein
VLFVLQNVFENDSEAQRKEILILIGCGDKIDKTKTGGISS